MTSWIDLGGFLEGRRDEGRTQPAGRGPYDSWIRD
jgi:hypothetical protein